MKCIWKITKSIPAFLDNGKLNVSDILFEIHLFLLETPPLFWKSKASDPQNGQGDMPLRTIKTILHELVNIKGGSILESSKLLPDQAQNHTIIYINQMIANLNKKKINAEESKSPNSKVLISSFDAQEISNKLDEIFSQIADKEQTKEGIKKLYEIRKSNPNISHLIEERISKTGTYFQGYINRTLSSLAQDNAKTVRSESTVFKTDATNKVDYNQSLQNLQRMFNKDKSSVFYK